MERFANLGYVPGNGKDTTYKNGDGWGFIPCFTHAKPNSIGTIPKS